ncbi:sporulation protein YqfD [Mangrovibacillus cuniculi]|uniref:Sporulation protein YqfD n=1 Tax=Mangrovibacillus cuniculi TaxID=2593652 RepID=A0A7S8HFY6_9BACI|nr:sporulation protein YqfD [Mangrovibacillus cuniculi]QPC46925.1 sporulation protein YqfD [Mangrovibacillus cuniculi]
MQFALKSTESIQKTLTDRMNNITWVGVELKGTTYHLTVVEKNEPEKEEYVSPRHLVAKKKAVIQRLVVDEGLAIVKLNDYVKKGDILVSGNIGAEDKPQLVAAKGVVLAETWYTTEAELPLKSEIDVLTGENKTMYRIGWKDTSIPIWGFWGKDYQRETVEKNTSSFHFLGMELPITFTKQVIHESELGIKTYTKKEAKDVLFKLAREDVLSKVSDDATIKKEKILHERVENGKVKVTIYYQVIEDIAIAQPIVQGD